MDKKNTIIGGVILILVIAGMFAFAYIKKQELEKIEPLPQQQNTQPQTAYDSVTRIDAKHFFINGTHTLVGEISLPTPCDLLNWTSRVAESQPEQVTIEFSVVNNAESCAAVITQQRFKLSFDASKDATMKALFMDREVELNLIPGGPGETPDDFELFIKG